APPPGDSARPDRSAPRLAVPAARTTAQPRHGHAPQPGYHRARRHPGRAGGAGPALLQPAADCSRLPSDGPHRAADQPPSASTLPRRTERPDSVRAGARDLVPRDQSPALGPAVADLG